MQVFWKLNVTAPGGTVNQALTTDERTPLWMAAQEGHIDAVKVLIEAACDVNQPSDDNQTALSTSNRLFIFDNFSSPHFNTPQ